MLLLLRKERIRFRILIHLFVCFLLIANTRSTDIYSGFQLESEERSKPVAEIKTSFKNDVSLHPAISSSSPWNYKKNITLNPATPEDDYQIKVQLTPLNFNYSNANADGSDLRFNDSNGNPLSYWIETWNPTGTSIVWVQVSTAGTSTISMYYGYSSATPESNGEATFLFFDDFPGTTLNASKWTTDTDSTYSSMTIGSSIVDLATITPNDYGQTVYLGFNDFYVNHGMGFGNIEDNGVTFGADYGRGDYAWTVVNNDLDWPGDASAHVVPHQQWFTGEIRWVNSSFVQFDNSTGVVTHTNASNIPTEPLQIRLLTVNAYDGPGTWWGAAIRSINDLGQPGCALRARSWHQYNASAVSDARLQCDWVLVRKCSDLEPVVTVGDAPKMWDGDQVISTITLIENDDIILNGNLSIQAGGNLTLRNTKLQVNCITDGQHHIEVADGGILTIERNSIVTAYNASNAWFLEARAGSQLYLRDSNFSYAGWEFDILNGRHSGLWINTDDAEVRNCSIHDNLIGLYFFEANGSLIANSTIMNSYAHGIGLNQSSGCIISNNTVANNSLSIFLEQSANCHIANNTIQDSRGNGAIQLEKSSNNHVVNNVITNCAEQGIALKNSSSNCTVSGNSISSGLVGIPVSYSSVDCIIANNTINWTYAGISLGQSANRALVSGNIIMNSIYYGIWVNVSSSCTISNNIIFNSSFFGVFLEEAANNNLIEQNDFLNNSVGGTSQASDNCLGNIFRYNYWDNWTSPDNNGDGIVDNSYSIDGSASNTDPSPLVAPYNGYVLLRLTSLFPSGNETLSGTVTIRWTAPTNLLGYATTYAVYYSPDSGSTWVLLDSDLMTATYSWDTTSLDDGSNYLIMIEATDSYGFAANFTSGKFTIFNARTVLVTVLYPNGGEVLNGSVDISWSVNDTSIALAYQIQYSWDRGASWSNLAIHESSTSPVAWSWDTTQHHDNWLYLIRVTVITTKAIGNDTSDAIFSIDNDPNVISETFEEINGVDNVFEVSSTITVSLDVSTPVNVTVKQISPENAPPTPSDLDALEIFVAISLSDPMALMGLWINVSFAELPEDQDPSDVRIYFYNETSESWQLAKQTSVDYENEVIWAWTDHLTTFGVMSKRIEEPEEDQWLLLVLLLVIAALIVISVIAMTLYWTVQRQRRLLRRQEWEKWER